MSYQYVTEYNSPNYTTGNNSLAVFGHSSTFDSITIHHWGDPAGNPTFIGVVNWLCNPNSGVSAHYVVEANKVACLVDLHNIAWHAGSPKGNASTIALELNPRASDADYETAAELISELWSYYGIKPLLGHNYWTSTACPGKWDISRLTTMATQKLNTGSSTSPVQPPKPSVATYHTVVRGETLYGLARAYGTTVSNLVSLNKLPNANKIVVGQKLRFK